ncbi:NUDIX hydrolase [Vannielia litorea]|uniref:8-oxo-dGTP pyrophosphatase MutT, NUDIX family n=1 Tax=Vannielia litorea TaxID=1217970 RepID=A0A1N6EF94_9RHOB|nr:NUDIX hydrolase [Vannielia litorea]SIN81680.1 8-oxo-dGTP pyrophosphatase MutT, NUDIX family [Vannielia litorea]
MIGRNKRGLRTQFGALCYRVVEGETQVLLITSRTRKRWIIPKGWPMDGRSGAQAAAREAWEEAGATGNPVPRCLGVYHYIKVSGPRRGLPCLVAVFPLDVTELHKNYPERKQRKRKWFSLAKAAEKVAEPELRAILAAFTPEFLPGVSAASN